tara:strand:- start:4758 stop:5075 length:318 start_codon:yes stop_codon:yes gene_type:complete
MTNTLEITENATKQIAKLLEKEAKGSFFRVKVEGGGCSGFKYNFSIDDKINETDLKIQQIVVDRLSHDFLKNSKLDFEQNLMSKSFRIVNPDAKASCGCGISFSI